ncbi:unnamed protein product [Nippostrongylus brasiliensis]|uniref:Apple domain-containing protein n=1 Tax=Nippostrongylus brasiliensis TaxID=27835 RepID=A0A0N4XKU9_NIPBR|nr:unnamed protein product [Nippostrongylus brasiliensis]
MTLSPIKPFSECAGAVQFVVSSNVDEETVELLLNETTVSSGNECAQLCFDLKCGFAYYEPSKKLCRLSADTEHVVDASGCSSNDDFKSIVPEEKPVQITCVSCAAHKTSVLPPKCEFPQFEFLTFDVPSSYQLSSFWQRTFDMPREFEIFPRLSR